MVVADGKESDDELTANRSRDDIYLSHGFMTSATSDQSAQQLDFRSILKCS
jgi:hypothetical protein